MTGKTISAAFEWKEATQSVNNPKVEERRISEEGTETSLGLTVISNHSSLG
jgi:hypothetical protein